MSNEIGGAHAKEGNTYLYPQGGVDWQKAQEWNDTLYHLAREWDDSRFIGLAIMTGQYWQAEKAGYPTQKWASDYQSYNLYYGWYEQTFDDFGRFIDIFYSKNADCPVALSEYGAGANPFTHSDDPMTTTQTGTGGTRHDEEYANLFHEAYVEQIIARPWLSFTSVWTLFDFAVANRDEGGIPRINDKGLTTRDRQTKKDAFYLYKAWFREDIPVVHITSKRFNPRSGDIVIKVYANTDALTLYIDDIPVQLLFPNAKIPYVWQFQKTSLEPGTYDIRVEGQKAGVQQNDHFTLTITNEE